MYVPKKKNNVRVKVTQEDINAGRRKSCGGCPLALALSRALGRECVVGPVCWWIDGDDTKDCVRLGRDEYNFRVKFDDGFHVAPFTFYVERW